MTAIAITILSTPAATTNAAISSGAAVGQAAESSTAEDIRDLERAAPERCPHARRGLRFYRMRHGQWVAMRGAAPSGRGRAPRNCADARYLAGVWRGRSLAQRRVTERWLHEYAWWIWLPDKWARIGACETGYGKRPGQWTWNSGTYEGAFGFYYGTWDAYRPAGAPHAAYLATPRQQYEAALNVYADHGYGAWGCGGA